jgi:HPt (histidine-containing phosphotransfer) domain-containing protein
LEQACADQDWPLVRSLAHQLKGVAATFGLPEATRVAGAVEFQVVRQDYAEVRVLVG